MGNTGSTRSGAKALASAAAAGDFDGAREVRSVGEHEVSGEGGEFSSAETYYTGTSPC